jgi:hypothetical protein
MLKTKNPKEVEDFGEVMNQQNAVRHFLAVTAENKKLFPKHRKQLEMLKSSTHPKAAKARIRLGKMLIRHYRKDTNTVGAIDWQKFRDWLKEHIGELRLAQLIISILSVLIFFI